ncbi:MAG: hypothetical protein EXS07_10135 [Gemmataceae bacterium]|nr:hypothetical protein [Gemmataceae bacterium]
MNSLNIFNNAFAHKHKKNGFHRPNYSKLEILGLEQRITPSATSGSSYSIILEPNDSVTGVRGYDATNVLLTGSYLGNGLLMACGGRVHLKLAPVQHINLAQWFPVKP